MARKRLPRLFKPGSVAALWSAFLFGLPGWAYTADNLPLLARGRVTYEDPQASSTSDSLRSFIDDSVQRAAGIGNQIITSLGVYQSEGISTLQTCKLRDRNSQAELASLAIGAVVHTESLPPEACGLTDHVPDRPIVPEVKVFREPISKLWQVEAHNIELPALIDTVSRQMSRPVSYSTDVRGTISAVVQADSLDEALAEIVRSAGYHIRMYSDRYVVGGESGARSNVELVDYSRPISSAASTENIHNTASARAIVEPTAVGKDSSPESSDAVGPPHVGEETVTESDAKPDSTREMRTVLATKNLISRGEVEKAKMLLRMAVKSRPDSAFLCRLLGECLILQEEYDEAITVVERSVQLNKQDPFANRIYGELLARRGQVEKATYYRNQADNLEAQRASQTDLAVP